MLACLIDGTVFQRFQSFPEPLQKSVSREEFLALKLCLGVLAQRRHDLLMGDSGEIALQQVPATAAQGVDEVQGVEYGEKHVPLSKQDGQIRLGDRLFVVADLHPVIDSPAGENVARAGPVGQGQGHAQFFVPHVVEPVDAGPPEKGDTGDGEGDGVRDAGLALAVVAGDAVHAAELIGDRLGEALEALHGQRRHLKFLDGFH